VLAEFYRPPAEGEAAAPPPPAHGGEPVKPPPPKILGGARWDGQHVQIEAEDPEIEAALRRIFRPSSVIAEDPSTGQKGARGPSTVQPGSLEWFRWAAQNRAKEEGLAVRLVAATGPGGWDPAASYRPFREQVRLLQSRG
jgi:hypothetical protein